MKCRITFGINPQTQDLGNRKAEKVYRSTLGNSYLALIAINDHFYVYSAEVECESIPHAYQMCKEQQALTLLNTMRNQAIVDTAKMLDNMTNKSFMAALDVFLPKGYDWAFDFTNEIEQTIHITNEDLGIKVMSWKEALDLCLIPLEGPWNEVSQ